MLERKLHGRLEVRNFSSRVEKYFSRSLLSLVKSLKFGTSARPCSIKTFALTKG